MNRLAATTVAAVLLVHWSLAGTPGSCIEYVAVDTLAPGVVAGECFLSGHPTAYPDTFHLDSMRLELQRLAWQAQVVVVGEVLAVSDSSWPKCVLTVAVDRILKGDLADDTVEILFARESIRPVRLDSLVGRIPVLGLDVASYVMNRVGHHGCVGEWPDMPDGFFVVDNRIINRRYPGLACSLEAYAVDASSIRGGPRRMCVSAGCGPRGPWKLPQGSYTLRGRRAGNSTKAAGWYHGPGRSRSRATLVDLFR